MPYIYTHSEQQRKITVIVICHLRRIWARARVALNLHFVSAPSVPINRQPSQATLIPRRHNARIPALKLLAVSRQLFAEKSQARQRFLALG